MTPTPEQTRKCSNCMWWTIPDGGEFKGLRECRGGPPTTSLEWSDEDGAAPNYWPRTRATNWCGSFRMKDPG